MAVLAKRVKRVVAVVRDVRRPIATDARHAGVAVVVRVDVHRIKLPEKTRREIVFSAGRAVVGKK